jgi:hypothetical protein
MKKILLGLVAALVIAVGGFFGFQFYVQQKITSEIDTAFDQIRSAGGKASHGKVSFDPLKRVVTIAGIEGESASQPSLHVKIANLTASGASQADATHFTADTIAVAGVEVEAAMAAPAEFHLAYKMPAITLKDVRGHQRSVDVAPKPCRNVRTQLDRQDQRGLFLFGPQHRGNQGRQGCRHEARQRRL